MACALPGEGDEHERGCMRSRRLRRGAMRRCSREMTRGFHPGPLLSAAPSRYAGLEPLAPPAVIPKAGGAAHVVAAPRRFFASPALACRARVSSASARISILPRRDRQVSITSPHHACMRKLRAKGRRVSNTPANVPASPRAALRAAPAPNASRLGVLVRGREADAGGAALRPETAGPAPTPPIRNRPSGTAGSHRPPAAVGGSGRTHSRSASASFPAARGRPWSSRS